MEVTYTGIRQTPEMVVDAALQQDVDVIGLSILSGAHMELLPQIFRGLEERDMDDVLVIVGGIIPEEDRFALKEMGVLDIFGPGTLVSEISVFIREAAGDRKRKRRARYKV